MNDTKHSFTTLPARFRKAALKRAKEIHRAHRINRGQALQIAADEALTKPHVVLWMSRNK